MARPPSVIDLLETADPEGKPRDSVPDPSWRADALGRSRHSRLADEMREPLDDPDAARAELVCAQITRQVLRDYAPALLLVSAAKRRRVQALTAWTRTLFDLALRPGLAGLDGDRMAQINAWEFQTEEALSGNPPGQPVFVAMAGEEDSEPWPRDALDRIAAAARTTAVRERKAGSVDAFGGVAEAILEALFGSAHPDAALALAPLLDAALESREDGANEAIRAVDVSKAPPGWRRAASYVKRAQLKSSSAPQGEIGLGRRLGLLIAAAIRPR